MRNIKLTIEYDGSRYSGWQRLGKGESTNTIENKLLEIIKKMTGETLELFCGARTEVGVHAYAQIANFKTHSNLKLYEMKNYFNRYLPMDIAIIDIEEMTERFHSSLNAKSKKYLYRIAIGDVPSVFDRKYTYYSFAKLDIKLMQNASEQLLGKHNFKAFTTAKKCKSTEKEIYSIQIEHNEKEIHIIIHANDFLHNMARMIVAYLMEAGAGKLNTSSINDLICGKVSEASVLPAEASGLFLLEIQYETI
ncbi:tRNA pseudouridine(38-40) synthase [Lachnotalea glycerini]|uniref:tRNA pseudouridine synthase A n=1 Tax=Lachnotalea glycerini TaxID=1763509 RepID=A0A255IKR4_9FIRM|nr:tRNA pseudouridine(38-40) synthase TruA [Lachnotalea glycerini]PXV89368.1 tRNA pseudouridine(38-40) synthase [Lachnotalea glycerini]RDY30769.1 tRNA pseudouridine(38-40) synthase TruA [Lachnotalea glycerini]